MTVEVTSPVGGAVVGLSEVPDPVFAEAMVGPGVAVRPTPSAADAVAPIDGTVAVLHPHAFVVTSTDGGTAVLVHLGIDTVKLDGAGFTAHVAKGATVRAGQPMIGWDPVAVAAAGYATVCPVIALDTPAEAITAVHDGAAVAPGDPLFSVRS